MKRMFIIYSFDNNRAFGKENNREYRICTAQEWEDKQPNGLLHCEDTVYHKSPQKALKQWLKKNNPSDWVYYEG